MRIFHGPQNIGGMAGLLAKEQRSLGAEAKAICFPTGNYTFDVDEIIPTHSTFGRNAFLLKLLGQAIINFDVFQFYFGESLTGPKLWDVALLKKLGKKVFFYFCGCDLRDATVTIKKYKFSACKDCWPVACSANRNKAIAIAQKYADGVFVSTPDLLEFFPESILLPQPANLDSLKSATCDKSSGKSLEEECLILHAPTNRAIKGSVYIEHAIKRLKSEGYKFKFKLIEKISHNEALKEYAKADIIIDQLLIGSYGQFSVEMMALGKAVICYIREDLRSYYPEDLPIISANPGTIYEVLKNTMESFKSLKSIGREGILYTSAYHDSSIIAKKMIDAYRAV